MAHYLHGVQSWTPLRFYDTKWRLSGVVQCKVDHGFLYATNEFRLEIKSTQYLYVNLFINNQLAFNRDKISYVFNEIYKYNIEWQLLLPLLPAVACSPPQTFA